MGPGDAIATCLAKYIEVRGRASRPEFWWFVAFLFLGSTVTAMADAQLTRALFPGAEPPILQRDGMLSFLFAVGVLPPFCAVAWRRMHDTGRSGFELFQPLILVSAFVVLSFFGGGVLVQIGLIGPGILLGLSFAVSMGFAALMLLFWLIEPGQPFENEFGPAPTHDD